MFATADSLNIEPDALATVKGDGIGALAAGRAALERLDETDWRTDHIQEALQQALIEDLGLKPRVAFGSLRVATSGRRVSPPLFESMELLGRAETLARIDNLTRRLPSADQ